MKIEETKCDCCGRIMATPGRGVGLQDETAFLFSVPIELHGGGNARRRKLRDFCNEDCLLEFLVKRKKTLEDERMERLKNPIDPFACVFPKPVYSTP